MGRLSAKRFDKLSSEYETDQKNVKAEILYLQDAPNKSSGHRKQKIKIYYKAAGIINIADED